MKYFLFLLFFLQGWLPATAQTFESDMQMEPTRFVAVGNTWAFKSPTGEPVALVEAGHRYTVVGGYGEWWIVAAQNGEQFLVVIEALMVDLGGEPPIQYGYIYPPGYEPASEVSVLPYYGGSTTHATYIGPRNGEYYYNRNGNKQYITPQSTIDENVIQTGPRGGQYYINGNGRKTYIKK